VCFWIGSPKFSYKGISPNELILWESMKSAIEKGYEFYEIMGADDLALYPFKSKFNAELNLRLTIRWFSPKFRLVNAIYRAIKQKEY
jgi:lipid II:glycine glycyltransferase (peptidoglycan interpeptide bridge formation enzyme)